MCPKPAGIDRERALGCPVRFGAPESRAVLWRAPLERPLPRHDPALFAYLERHAQALLAGVPAEGGVVERVQRLITEGLRSGEPVQAEVARRLALSERTLQRGLREADTSFAAILDAVRRQLAQLHLSERSLALHEVAFLLGYSEPSAFHRAFRRWTGQTPQEFRGAGVGG
jgi:AraC-like DNA-binding protein